MFVRCGKDVYVTNSETICCCGRPEGEIDDVRTSVENKLVSYLYSALVSVHGLRKG